MLVPLFVLAALGALGAPDDLVQVTATYVAPAGAKGSAAIAVAFDSRDPDVRVDREPAPRLKLDPAQRVLAVKPGAAPRGSGATGRYLLPSEPVLFPVVLAAGAPRGDQPVRTSVTYFYCSQSAGWCRKGTVDVDVRVTVR